ncbi:VOC family protein [Georgenia faecalis]|uniref:VOC family protein n=1 Tax=Georgenia faecalis TaxID=2483799 RepID=A0ABV9D8A2_9MICO|nr:VOC family protein [Georgenia faecalis]
MDQRPGFPLLRQTVIDTSDPRTLAEFYRRLLGLRYREGDEGPDEGTPDWLTLVDDAGAHVLAFQHVAGLPRPAWPEGTPPQMMHLDLMVSDTDDLARQVDTARALGAEVVRDRSDDPEEPLYVLTDPSGHPFCLFVG